ncbi:hypothetical protein ABAZ39_15000 (plasmid) [Azospirillum argentinense]|uniref:Uncharacterized protein n=1 Tax=Azospirillum argentinense TaxID=2970906 RepID=A0A060DQ03_9PROT|nr:hypothetical protein ABAZ39_15000 [Azospirillum argentinense]EZQ06385.1 hypothetical protein ABAZ39_14595 [Azospirillum argentinense]MBK3802086.1 hypothetical protein [Azospirillum argentinense]PNQ95223.1 hypothetical protein C1S70_30030 [Azospirillum argentinense]
MMGERTVMQEALFYEFSLERHVPAARPRRHRRFAGQPDRRPVRNPFPLPQSQPEQPHRRQPVAHLILGLLVRTTRERKRILPPSACRR